MFCMENISIADFLNDLLCKAYSVNFMVLQQRKIAIPDTDQMVFTTEDIFRKKSFVEEYEQDVFDEMVRVRNEVFEDIDRQLEKFDLETLYKNNTNSLIDCYNEYSSVKISYEQVFSKKMGLDFTSLEIMHKIIENGQFKSDYEKSYVIYIFNKFLEFYEDLKTWITNTELIQAIEDDIGQYGNKTFSYKKPSNPNIFIMEKSFFEDLFNNISAKLSKSHPELFKKQSKKQRENLNETEQLLEISTDFLYSFYDLFSDRFEYANLPYIKNKEGVFGIIKKLLVSQPKNSKLVVDNVYVHKNELDDLARILEFFPELASEKEKVQSFIDEHSQNNEKTLKN